MNVWNSSKRAYVEPFSPALDSTLCIRALKWEDSYKYLGVNIGRERKGAVDGLEEEILAAAGKIFDSPLSDWQKIEAVNSFVITKANYHFNAATLDQSRAIKLDAKMRRLVKRALRLPTRTARSTLQNTMGASGSILWRITSEDIRFLHYLSSPDKILQDIGWSQHQQPHYSR